VYEVSYNSRTSYVSNYSCCLVRPEGLLNDAACDLLAMAKLLAMMHATVGFRICV